MLRKTGYIIGCCLLFSLSAAAQREATAIDSLKRLIATLTTDSSRAYYYDALAKDYMDTHNDSALLYGDRSLKLARKVKVVQYEVDALNTLGIVHRKKGLYNEALAYHLQAMELAEKHKLGTWYLSTIYQALALAYTDQGNFKGAIEYGYKALHEAERQNDPLSQAISNNNLADIYFNSKQYDKALGHYRRALHLATVSGNLYGQGLLSGNIGSVYYEKGKLDSARIFYERAVAIARQVDDLFGEACVLQNLASYYQRTGDLPKAIDHLMRAGALFEEQGLEPNLSTNYLNLASCYLDQGAYKKALGYGDKSLALAKKTGSYPHIESAHLLLKNVYEKLDNPVKAYYHYREHVAARDSTFNQENRRAQYKTELAYEYAKKRDADSLSQVMNRKLQEEELRQAQLRTETQRKFTYAAVAACALLLVLLVFIFKGYRDKQKANRIITAQQRETQLQKQIVEEKQKEILDSIYYARRIQQSLLPNERTLHKLLKRLQNNSRSSSRG